MTDTIHVNLWHGDCKQRLQELADNSVDLALCDPPYGLEFMGKEWDKLDLKGDMTRPDSSESSRQRAVRGMEHGIHAGKPAFNLTRESQHAMQKWHGEWLVEVYRVLKPSCWAKVFSATRTFHRVCAAMEDAGFEGVKDHLEAWTYGSGFPKSLNISKALDKMANANRKMEREIQAYLQAARKDKRLSKKAVDDAVFGGTTRYSWVEGRGGERAEEIYLPTPEEWERLKEVLDLDDRYDAYIKAAIPMRELRFRADGGKAELVGVEDGDWGYQKSGERWDGLRRNTRAVSELAKKWEGYGTALKPAWEPIVCGRKPG